MRDFSFEYYTSKIYNSKTKDYFTEVLRCYFNGCFRSSIVVLYSVVVCDIIFRLQELKDIYNDNIASDILDQISDFQNKRPNSPDWESKLIEEVKTRTKLFDIATYHEILYLQKNRHISAHPILSENNILFNPNEETVRAHIRNMLEGLLIKPPMLSRKIFDQFINDLAEKRDSLNDEISLKRYLNSKYIPYINSETYNYLFKTLWKLVFCLADPDCDINRDINYYALRIIYFEKTQELNINIQNEVNYYSNISSEEDILTYLIKLLLDRPNLYRLFNDEAHIILEKFISKEKSLIVFHPKKIS